MQMQQKIKTSTSTRFLFLKKMAMIEFLSPETGIMDKTLILSLLQLYNLKRNRD